MPVLEWRKSSFSNEQDNCVELAVSAPARLLIRESDAPDTVLATNPARLRALLQRLKD
ncbi:DUF397 domain-containing protein [Streptomyces sp. NPDC127098]|uniref:DUF397 domain-containing protein n=1 Tax=Streptomyces sp. NPDC127098 TaxID=3347137 RepID=UPI003656714C